MGRKFGYPGVHCFAAGAADPVAVPPVTIPLLKSVQSDASSYSIS
jgi:hypothetical protein